MPMVRSATTTKNGYLREAPAQLPVLRAKLIGMTVVEIGRLIEFRMAAG